MVVPQSLKNVWFIADTHFGHKNIIQYCNRPFETVEEMNEELIKRWNSKVKKEDKIYMLGDFALGGIARVEELLSKLNGYKILILGNHDNFSVQKYLNAGFNEVSRLPVLFNDYFLLSHAPLDLSPHCRFANIYGHVHDDTRYKTFSNNTCCVSAERFDYYPVNFYDIYEGMRKAAENGEQDNK